MIKLTSYSGDHQGGTKAYKLSVLHSTANSRFLLIKRWGKIGADGQMKIESGSGNGETTLDKALDERSNKGYRMLADHPPVDEFADGQSAIIAAVPRSLQSQVLSSHIAQIDGGVSVKGEPRDKFDPLAKERATLRMQMEEEAQRQKDAERQAEAQASEDELKSNKFYGMF